MKILFRLSISQINSCKLRIWFWSEWKSIQSELSKEQFHIQCQDIYPELMEDLQKLVASPLVTGLTVTKSRMESNFILAENEFPSTFLKALATSGVETKWAPTYILISSFELSKRLVSYSLYFVNISDIWISGWKTVFSIWWEAKVLKSGSRWIFYTWASHIDRKPFCRSSILEEWGSHLHILPRCRWGTLANLVQTFLQDLKWTHRFNWSWSGSMGEESVEEFELNVHGARSEPRQASLSERAAGTY